MYLILVIVAALAALGFAAYNFFSVKKLDEGTSAMKEIAAAIREGANAFINYEYKVLYLVVGVVAVIMATGGLTTIVSYYFQYLGYFGQICGVIPMAIVWPILRAKGVKPIIPAPLKSSSGQQK